MMLHLFEDIKKQEDNHPLAPTVCRLKGSSYERELLDELKGRAQLIYNTSKMKPRELREKILNEFSLNKQSLIYCQCNIIWF